MFDNRNGTRDNTNTDVFLFKSINGGATWIGPTRVNDDPSPQPANRNCGRGGGNPACPAPAAGTGNDQFWPWVDINNRGDLNVGFHDRRLDTDSVASEWPTSRFRPGNYLVWYWGAKCTVSVSNATACVAPTATTPPQPTGPVNPGNALFPEQTVFPFDNFTLSDVPSNFDYSFRAGIFAGDYTQIAVADADNTVWGLYTDARNGRSLGRRRAGTRPASRRTSSSTAGAARAVALPRRPQALTSSSSSLHVRRTSRTRERRRTNRTLHGHARGGGLERVPRRFGTVFFDLT